MIEPRDHVENWLRQHQTRIGVPASKWQRSELHAEMFNAWYETEKYLIDICCWNHACCLDIIALNKQSKTEDFIVAGDCDGLEGLSERLAYFENWLEENR